MSRGDFDDWEQVAEVSQLYLAELMALRLRENGIDARVLDQSFRQEPLTSVRSFSVVRVLVPKGRAPEARRILDRTGEAPLGEHHTDEPEWPGGGGGRDEG